MLTKADRQDSQFKGRILKGKMGGGGGEVRTQRLMHEERDAYATSQQRASFFHNLTRGGLTLERTMLHCIPLGLIDKCMHVHFLLPRKWGSCVFLLDNC